MNSKAFSVHCLAHCTNLCLQDVSRQSKPIRDALDLVFEIVKLIKFSPKRLELFSQMQVRSGADDPRSLRPLCPTRWTVRTGSIGDILSKYQALLDTLEEVQLQNDEYGRRAGGQAALMEKFSTFLGLKLAYHVFSRAKQLSINIQGKDTAVQSAMNAVRQLQMFYRQQRTEEAFNKFYGNVLADSRDLTDSPQHYPGRKRRHEELTREQLL